MDADKCHLVQWNSIFSISGHVCIEFELLDKSLYDFVKERNFRPLQLKEIRPVVHQVCSPRGKKRLEFTFEMKLILLG